MNASKQQESGRNYPEDGERYARTCPLCQCYYEGGRERLACKVCDNLHKDDLETAPATPSADGEIERIAERYVSQGCYAQVIEALKIYHRSHANEREELRKKIVYHDSLLDEREAKHADQIGELATELNEARATLAAREVEIERIRGQLLSHERMAAAGVYVDTEKYSGMVVQISTLQAELATAQAALSRAQAARNSNADDRDAALNERDQLKAELATAQSDVQTLTKAHRELAERFQAAFDEAHSLRSQLTEAQKLISDNHLVIEGLGDDLKEANAKLAEERQERKELARQLLEIQHRSPHE